MQNNRKRVKQKENSHILLFYCRLQAYRFFVLKTVNKETTTITTTTTTTRLETVYYVM